MKPLLPDALPRFITHHSPSRVLRVALILCFAVATAVAATAQPVLQRTSNRTTDLQVTNGHVAVSLFSGEFVDYRTSVSFDETPPTVQVAWQDLHTGVGSAHWMLYRPDSQDGLDVVATGALPSPPSQPDQSIHFTLPLGEYLPARNTTAQAHEYRLVVIWNPVTRQVEHANPRRIERTNRPRAAAATPRRIERVDPVPDGTRTIYATLTHLPYASRPSGTEFTLLGLRPELLHTMPIAIDLQTLRVEGDSDVEPYLLVAAIFADGTTIQPQLNVVEQQVEFPDSRVRVVGAPRTHGNIAGDNDMDAGQTVSIPTDTGHFETTLHPIGLELANQFNLSDNQKQDLRANTQIGILVVGLEEDAVPSTETIDEVRDLLLSEIQTEFDAIVRNVVVNAANPSQLPDLTAAVQEVQGELVSRIENAAVAKSIAELAGYLTIPAAPLLGLIPGVLNADDFVGADVFIISYQDLLEAGESGQAFLMNLTNPDEPARFVIQGRVRIR